jgi:hypothetical protein
VRRLEAAENLLARLDDGKALFRAMAAMRSMPMPPGDWAYCTARTADAALPGIRVPIALRRHSYFVRVITDVRKVVCLDFHAATLKPLFRHPLARH